MTRHTMMVSDTETVAEGAQALARIMILVVAYDAESTLAQVLDRIPPDVLAKVEQIVVFDDASQDSTFQVGQRYQAGDHPASAKLSGFRSRSIPASIPASVRPAGSIASSTLRRTASAGMFRALRLKLAKL